jgi:hypothetical protein
VYHVNDECRGNIYPHARIAPETAPFSGKRGLLGAAECFRFHLPGAEAAWELKGLARSRKSGVSFLSMNFLAIIISRPDVGHVPFLTNGCRG